MKQYKVLKYEPFYIYEAGNKVWSGKKLDLAYQDLVEYVLNHYAKQGWRLVSTGGELQNYYLYLERDI